MKVCAIGVAVLGVALMGAAGSAQETRPEEERAQTPRRRIRVLQDPSDISTFYRSREAPLVAPYGINRGPFDLDTQRYPIASYYRLGSRPRPGLPPYWSIDPNRKRRVIDFAEPRAPRPREP